MNVGSPSRRRLVCYWMFVALLTAAPTSLRADSAGESDETTHRGNWTGSLSIGGNVNVVSNQDVVGQNDGLSALLGLGLNGNTTFRKRANEFRGQLTLNESFARTSTVDEFVKNDDRLAVQGIYNRYFLPWTGGFGKADIETSIFQNHNVTGGPTDYRIIKNDGTETRRSGLGRIRLSEPFRPTSLKQTVGVFLNPLNSTAFSFRSRIGIGARETFAEQVFVLDDDSDTPETEIREIDNVYQGGLSGFLGVEGAFPEQGLTYQVGVESLLPILNNDDTDRSVTALTEVGVSGALSFAAFDWLSAKYTTQVTRDPQLVKKTQIQNNVMLTLKYDLISTREGSNEPSTKEKLDEAQSRIQKLEKRIERLEEEDDDAEAGSVGDSESDDSG